MKYGDYELNALQVSRVINRFFDDHFSVDSGVELESYIAKCMEDDDNDFLMYNEADMVNHIKYHERMIKEVKKLQARDFSTEKFDDEYYFEK